MKKHFFLVKTLLCFVLTSMFLNLQGQVGIGTNAPSNTLHIKNNADPIRIEGLTVADSTYAGRLMVVSVTGVVKYVALETLMKNSAQASPISSISSNYVLGATDNIVIITSGNPNITLPSASSANGRIYHIMSLVSGDCNYSTSITIHNGSVSKISGKSSDTIVSDGTTWYRLHHTN